MNQELQHLETQVAALLNACQQLQQENRVLHEQHTSIAAERNRLLQKHEQTRTRIEGMINRLKSLEEHAPPSDDEDGQGRRELL